MVAASTAVVGVLGLRGARTLGAHVGVVVAWLAALSPLLFTYGRFARPYALVALCGGVALAAAEHFRRKGDAGSAALLGVSVALGQVVVALAASEVRAPRPPRNLGLR